MSNAIIKYSPVHHLLEFHQPEWSDITGTPIAVRYDNDEVEREAMKHLGLCDLSGLTKLGLKGPHAEHWLAEQNVDVPTNIHDSCRLADNGTIVRLGADEFFLESGFSNQTVPTIETSLNKIHEAVFRVERQDATFLIVGVRAIDVLSQTCGINFQDAEPGRLIMSRVAGVSSGILPEEVEGLPTFRFWIDPTFAEYLWETLEEICKDLKGRVIGANCLYPELL